MWAKSEVVYVFYFHHLKHVQNITLFNKLSVSQEVSVFFYTYIFQGILKNNKYKSSHHPQISKTIKKRLILMHF